jgi:hypothetical protein
MKIFHRLVFGLFCSCLSCSVFADPIINAWISPTSGNWEDSQKWSLGSPPASGQTIMLTNQGWKAIAIGPNTASSPAALDVSSVILGGYTDSFNLLLLNYAGFETPLQAGSINVGTNSGITALASVLTISSNSGPGDLSIFSSFNQGEQATVNAHVINLGNVTNAGAGPGVYNQTNGIANADDVSLANGSTFNQFDGANLFGTLSIGSANPTNSGVYNMESGWLTGYIIQLYRGSFNQTGGSISNWLFGLGAGTYTLSGGILYLPGITIPHVPYDGVRNPNGSMGVNATFLQTGGTNFCKYDLTVYNERGAPGIPEPFYGPGHYVLSNGVLCVSSILYSGSPYTGAGGDFQQWGGWHTNAETHVVGQEMGGLGGPRLSSFTLGGGTMSTPLITVDYGDFVQSGGTALVSDLHVGTGMGRATFTLSGGLIRDENVSVTLTGNEYQGSWHVLFTQLGGTHLVTNLLHVSGEPPTLPYSLPYASSAYVLSNGVLNAQNIQIDNGGFFEHDGGTFTTIGLLTLGYSTWQENTFGQQFGRLLLSAPAGSNATVALPGNFCVLQFANSSSVAWSNQAGLLITNWNGSPNGGGNHQVYFGSSSSGLTAQQLSQIQFKNPNGLSGNFPARILSTGEIVPGQILLSQRSGNSLVLQWGSSSVLQSATNVAGPWQDVSGATSPYTVPFTGPQRFFRVRQ